MLSADEYEEIQYQLINCSYSIHVFTLVIGLMGNIVAFIVISSTKSFYTLTGFYLLSLTTADLLMLFTGIAFYVFSYKFTFLSQGKAVRYIAEWTCQTAMIVSIWTVTAFTVERYLAICHPFLVQSLPKKTRVKHVLVSIWSASILLALLPTAQVFIQNIEGHEYLKQTNENVMPYIADFWAALCFFVPMSVITVMYILIWIRLKKSSNGREITSCQANRADTKTMMMFVVIIAAFLVSWGPYYMYRVLYTHIIVLKFRVDESDYDFDNLIDYFYLVNLAKQTLYPLSTALNPVIFTMMSKKFREAFMDLLSKIRSSLFRWSLRLTRRSNESTVETTS